MRTSDTQSIPAERDGVVALNTGDKLVRVPGMESVVTPDGNGVVINTNDGISQLSVFGNAKVERRNPSMNAPEYSTLKPGAMPTGFT